MKMVIFWVIWLLMFFIIESIKNSFSHLHTLIETRKTLNGRIEEIKEEIKELELEIKEDYLKFKI